jgi:DNA end-binding protein Ku
MYSTSTGENTISFHLINPKTRTRIRMKPIDAKTGKILERDSLVRGYELEDGRYATVTDDELKHIRLKSTKVIEVEEFVDSGEIDPLYFDATYYLVPDGDAGAEAYNVIREAMRREKKIGIGRLVMSYRERLVAISPRENSMLLTRLRDAREVAELAIGVKHTKIDPRMVEIATQIIEQNKGKFEPAKFKDPYETALRAMIKRRERGAKPLEIKEVEDERPTNVIDLMAALEKSLGKRPRSSPKKQDDDGKIVRLHKTTPHRKPKSRKGARPRRSA